MAAMEIPASLLTVSSTAGNKFTYRTRDSDQPIGSINSSQLNQLATHLPDIILNMSLSIKPPFVRQFAGVVMFLDISG